MTSSGTLRGSMIVGGIIGYLNTSSVTMNIVNCTGSYLAGAK